jgi:hypothetical protein
VGPRLPLLRGEEQPRRRRVTREQVLKLGIASGRLARFSSSMGANGAAVCPRLAVVFGTKSREVGEVGENTRGEDVGEA